MDKKVQLFTSKKHTGWAKRNSTALKLASNREIQLKLMRGIIDSNKLTFHEIEVYVNYDVITDKLCDFSLKVETIKRSDVMPTRRRRK